MNCRIVLLIPLIGFVAVSLVGCSAGVPGESAQYPIPVRDFLRAPNEPEEGYGAYGYLLFKSHPDSVCRSRYLRICRAFLNELPSVEAFSRYERRFLMVTYLPVDSSFDVSRHGSSVDSLMNHYDYDRAMTIVAAVSEYRSPGPLLVAWRTTNRSGVPGASVLMLDMSNFADDDVANAFRIWKERITSSPEKWRRGFVLQTILIDFSGIVNRYGKEVFEVFSGFFSKSS